MLECGWKRLVLVSIPPPSPSLSLCRFTFFLLKNVSFLPPFVSTSCLSVSYFFFYCFTLKITSLFSRFFYSFLISFPTFQPLWVSSSSLSVCFRPLATSLVQSVCLPTESWVLVSLVPINDMSRRGSSQIYESQTKQQLFKHIWCPRASCG